MASSPHPLSDQALCWRPDPSRPGVLIADGMNPKTLCATFSVEQRQWTVRHLEDTWPASLWPYAWRLAYTSTDQLKPFGITHEATHIHFPLTTETSAAQLEAVIDRIDGRCALLFFDLTHPSPTDPGAGCTVGLRDDGLWMSCANHGWTGATKKTSPDAVLKRIQANQTNPHDSQRVLILEANPVVQFRAERPDGDRILSHSLYFSIEDIVRWSEGKRLRLIQR